jgi:hypothetical protein
MGISFHDTCGSQVRGTGMRTPDTTRLEHPTGLKSGAVEEEDPALPISHATAEIVGEYGAPITLLKIRE